MTPGWEPTSPLDPAAMPAPAPAPARRVTGDEAIVARALNTAPPEPGTPFEFTGQGGEYFRIWVVNTLLSLATVGIYSAWAKVRKASYFSRNTKLLGDSFAFDADPVAVLRGRLLAFVLLGFYTFAFDFSLTAGLVATTMLLATAPLLFASATRFRLQNTRWRGLRFGFTASHGDAYKVVFVVVALWLSSSVAAALVGEVGALTVAGVATLMLPWMHHRMKAFQHRHVLFAGQRSGFRSSLGRFYGTYFVALILIAGAGFAAALVAGVLAVASRGGSPRVVGIVVGVIFGAVVYLAAWPYFASRMQRTVWTRTTLGAFSFTTTIEFKTLFPIAAKNFALLLLTAGLYWPYAAVAFARYRIGCMRVAGAESVDAAVAELDAGASRQTAGEGAIDFFGIDIGW